MIPTAFDYERATSVDDAVAKLREAEGGKLIAGGHSLLPLMKLRLSEPRRLIDIARIPELRGIREKDGRIEIGAATTHHEVTTSPVLRQQCPMLADAAGTIGDQQVRNRGTIGGSLAHADPSAELPSVLLACDGTVHVAGPGATRRVGAADLFVGALQTDLGDAEMITEVELPVPDGWGFSEFARRHGDFAIVSAVATRFGNDLRVVIGGVAGVPHLVSPPDSAPDLLTVSGAVEADRVSDIADAAARGVEPASDLHGSAHYRRALTREVVRRAVAQLAGTPTSGRTPVPA
jgi:aerobic carbon-monoxide dehydrogenase medium subunit